ncbi:DUF3375 family protein [Actinoplanes sp. TFC3]|uniref:DUF3375 family protein n=1 Tax=Actinoplanes sp. TFC3 TaxID=1710355 RepID=UPI00082C11AF|nr:DUF3375 family protein [Actinoplanes sp. TFC3]
MAVVSCSRRLFEGVEALASQSAEQLLHEFRSNATADVTMSLLRSSDALLHLALMAAHLGEGQIVDGQSLAADMNADLPALLRSVTPSRDPDDAEVPTLEAEYLLTKWTKRGWVHRSIDPASRIERYQLTSGASQAVRQMRALHRHSSVATESALAMVMGDIRQIATEANPDPVVRRRALKEQIAALREQLDALDRGEVLVVNQRELVDKVAAVAQLIDRIPADIGRYGERMHANTATLLRQSLTDDPAEFAGTLQQMFDGHDVIAESPDGLAFRAFATVIATPSQRSQLESDITEITERVTGLPAHLRDALTGFIEAMWRRVQEVEGVRAVAFRRISNFVRGGDAAHYRSMRTKVSEAQAAAAEAFQRTHGGRDIGFVVPMSGVNARSVGRLRLHPGTPLLADPVVDSSDEFDIDPTALAGREAIDWAALRAAAHAAMDAHSGVATLHEVLQFLPQPRTGDIIGLWSLATRFGDVDPDARELVLAHTGLGLRELNVPYLVFGEPIPDLSPHLSRRRVLSAQPALGEGIGDA